MALAWVRAQPWGVVIPILGAKTLAQLQENMNCLNCSLTHEQRKRLDEVSQVDLGFPGDFLAQVREIVYGKTFPWIDDHRK